MKTVKDTLLQRKSIRRYGREKIEPEKMEFIYQAIQHSQTSYNGQQFSVISVSNQEIKEKIYEITGQKQIKTSAMFLVFCVDFHKLKVAAEAKSLDFPRFQDTMDGYTVGVIDAALAMQNAVVAAESMGLGTCCIGYTRTANPEALAKLFKLPEGVAIICGLSIGYPAEDPDMKPKLPLPLVIHHNHYRQDNMANELLQYNDNIQQFNASRSGTTSNNDWVEHILDYHRVASKYDIEKYLHDQGFMIKM